VQAVTVIAKEYENGNNKQAAMATATSRGLSTTVQQAVTKL